jgi:excisionase family DNA binding protein
MPLLSIKEVADRTQASTKTVRRWIEAEEIHIHRLGRVLRVSEEDLMSFLGSHRK